MGVTIDTSELLAVAADFGRAARAAQPLAAVAVRKATVDIEADAKTGAPVDTGNLRNSISSTVRVDDTGIEAEIGPTANYGIYVELGTSRMAPQPYLAPAYDRHTPALIEVFEAIADRTL